jgi:hypothetical protein
MLICLSACIPNFIPLSPLETFEMLLGYICTQRSQRRGINFYFSKNVKNFPIWTGCAQETELVSKDRLADGSTGLSQNGEKPIKIM